MIDAKIKPHGASPVNGILIEGVDYSGKTTVARRLLRHFTYAGLTAEYRKEFLTQNPKVLKTAHRANSIDFGYKQDLLLADATLQDIREYVAEDNVIVQDRHWLSVVGHLSFFYPNQKPTVCDLLRQEHLQFACQFYLTSTVEAKRSRITQCPPRSTLDKLLADDPSLHQDYDDHIRALIPQHENWFIIDTSTLTAPEVTQTIMRRLEYNWAATIGTIISAG